MYLSQATASEGLTFTVNLGSPWTGTQANPMPLFEDQNMNKASIEKGAEKNSLLISRNTPYLHVKTYAY